MACYLGFNTELVDKIIMALEEDIYEMYRDGPFDWFNPIDFMTSTLTGGPSGSWSEENTFRKNF